MMKIIRILNSGSPEMLGEQFVEFHRGLREAGYVDGQNITIEYRWANDDHARLPALATELVDGEVAVLVAAGGTVSALAAHRATKDIPIVFTPVNDPVKSGLVANLDRPGGNVTGIAGLTSELDPKRLELLHEFKPAAERIGVLVNSNRPGLEDQLQILQATAHKMNLSLEVQKASSQREIDAAFTTMLTDKKVQALLVTADPFFYSRRTQVVAGAKALNVPAIYQWSGFVVAGGLMSYGPSIADAYRQAGTYAGRILKGAKPSDLPVVQPTKFDLVINVEEANAFGGIPPELLARAIVPPKEPTEGKIIVVSTYTGP
jgi:putative ABC transport system substrate-binding protein